MPRFPLADGPQFGGDSLKLFKLAKMVRERMGYAPERQSEFVRLILASPTPRSIAAALPAPTEGAREEVVALFKDAQSRQADAGDSEDAETFDSLLFRAVQLGCSAAVQLLLSDGANPNVAPQAKASKVGLSPIHVAVSNGQTAIATLLLAAGAKVTAGAGYGSLPLHIAATVGLEMTTTLLQFGAPPLATDKNRQTALHTAARAGRADVVAYLLRETPLRGAIDKCDRWFRTPLSWAAMNGHRACVEELLKAGASVGENVRLRSVHKASTSARLVPYLRTCWWLTRAGESHPHGGALCPFGHSKAARGFGSRHRLSVGLRCAGHDDPRH